MSENVTPSRIDAQLAWARKRLKRLEPADAHEAVERGALLIDIRPEETRNKDGVIPGALAIERNVLEWRLDPTSPHRVAHALDASRAFIIFCDEGYASSLAAASLHVIGVHNATDLIGGFRAWHTAGLPTVRLLLTPDHE
jgi:rhodanese-related sulfurtransferase